MFHFIVMTRGDNTFDSERIEKYISILDKIEEETEGPGVLVTIGTGKRNFSSGFDLPFWMADYKNMKASIIRMQHLLARLLEFPLPSMCIFNGNAIAGGYILGLAHDFRIMNANVGTICLSELKLGLPLPAPYNAICAAKLNARVCNKIFYGITLNTAEGLKDELIDETFASPEDLHVKLGAFAKRYAAMGVHRLAIKTNKQNQFDTTIEFLKSYTFTTIDDEYFKASHPKFVKTVTGIFKAQQAAKKKAAAAKPKL